MLKECKVKIDSELMVMVVWWGEVGEFGDRYAERPLR